MIDQINNIIAYKCAHKGEHNTIKAKNPREQAVE